MLFILSPKLRLLVACCSWQDQTGDQQMYFFVDESGHTGNNLFDSSQPTLHYGVLSSTLNVNVLARAAVLGMRRKLGVDYLHANQLGMGRLAQIGGELTGLQNKLDLRFDCYRVAKVDHAYIQFFDQVFDQGLNKAVPWTSYWSPMRYSLLLRVATLMDEDLVKRAWAARINANTEEASAELAEVCRELRNRVPGFSDERTCQIVYDTLTWAIEQPDTLQYNATDRRQRLWISPNLVGFQSVMFGIASRIAQKKPTSVLITVDQQSEFNKQQRSLAEFYGNAKNAEGPLTLGPGMPELNFRHMPETPIQFASHTESVGLELVDVYLWLFKRLLQRDPIAPELERLVDRQLKRGRTDEVSLEGIARRWEPYFRQLEAREFTNEELERAKELQQLDEARRGAAMRQAGLEMWSKKDAT